MLLTKTCLFNRKKYSREVDITPEEYDEYIAGHRCIQDVFPFLSADDREFIMTGTPPDVWDDLLG